MILNILFLSLNCIITIKYRFNLFTYKDHLIYNFILFCKICFKIRFVGVLLKMTQISTIALFSLLCLIRVLKHLYPIISIVSFLLYRYIELSSMFLFSFLFLIHFFKNILKLKNWNKIFSGFQGFIYFYIF